MCRNKFRSVSIVSRGRSKLSARSKHETDRYLVSCCRHQAIISSIVIFDLSTVSPDAAFDAGAAADGAFSTAGTTFAVASAAGDLAAGAAPTAPPARAAA